MRELLIKLLADVCDVAKNVSKAAVKTDKDIVTECDIAIGRLVRETILGWEYPIQIVTEEFGNAEKNCETPEYSVFVDELDGTDNAFRCMTIFPSVTLIQIAKTASEEVKFKDFVLVGAVEHSTGTVYIAEAGEGRIHKYKIKDSELIEVPIAAFHPKNAVVIVDNYSMTALAPESDVLVAISSNFQTKDFGASAATYLWVAEGLFEAYASSHKKGHELPLLYLLCKENGIPMTTFDGAEYDEIKYDFNVSHYQVIAGIPEVHEQLLEKLKPFAKKF